MSPATSHLPTLPRPGQHSPSHSTAAVLRGRHAQSQSGAPFIIPQTYGHHRNLSVTSNPAQILQEPPRYDSDDNYRYLDQSSNLPTATSPASFQPSADIYNFQEDTSHHDSSLDDFFSTEGSSENHLSEETTPQEFIWEQQFLAHDPAELHILDPYSAVPYDPTQGVSQSFGTHSIFQAADGQLTKSAPGEELSGQSLNTTAPPFFQPLMASETLNQASNQNMKHSSMSVDNHKGSGSQTLRVDTNPHRTPSPSNKVDNWQRTTSGMRVPSPVVMVSSYEAAGPEHPIQANNVQSSSKRSRESASSDDESDGGNGATSEIINVDAIPYLMPPDANDTGFLQRIGLEPHKRTNDVILSVKDLEEQRQLEEKNAEVQTWLATSDAGSEAGDDSVEPVSRHLPQGSRRRAHTTGARFDAVGPVYSDKNIPGPGVLVEVESDDEYFDDETITSSVAGEHTEQVVNDYHQAGSPRMSPKALEARESSDNTAFPTLEDEIAPEQQEPLPHQFYRRGPWQDAIRGPVSNAKDQPDTSNAAAYKFNQEAAKWETASRAATWGTRRRLSESEISSIVEGSQVRHLSLSKRGRERGSSILNKARGLLPRRSSSNIKAEESTPNGSATKTHTHRSSVGTVRPAQRMPSFSKPMSPPLDTGSALMRMTGQLTAVGRGSTGKQETEQPKPSRTSLKKQRSKSDVSKQAKSSNPGLAELMTRHGGPPVPTLASPMYERESIIAAQVIDNEDAQADDDEDDQTDEVAIRMDLTIRAEDIVPTVEGFKDHARKLNPRLEPYMIDRIGQEQIRRYKKLVESKIKHTRSVQVTKKCTSGKFCFELGGEAALLAPRPSSKDPESTLTQFQINNPTDNDIDESGIADGVVTPALFPAGIPLPPVKRLPAEFECSLCFKVKKFQKPSDWTKHVHEDIQPFSCTFPNCPESKSFKRKADWVRHENERHRHLEWWKCSVGECVHVCYRKDNFVQHLVREHKMPEPKIKGRGSGSSKMKPANPTAWQAEQEDHEVWHLVKSCHSETQSKARDEQCRFCGNVCSTFKKLSVHMGKHMEQIAMPVLELVSMRQVSADTIISPVEQPLAMPSSLATFPATVGTVDLSNLSPYPTSATSAYQTSSAGQSPVSMQSRMHNGGFNYEQGYYSPHTMPAATQGQTLGGTYDVAGVFPHPARGYMGGAEYMPSSGMSGPQEYNLSPQGQIAMPRSQPIASSYGNPAFGSAGGDYSQAPMQSMYTNAPSMPGYLPQYGPSMVHGPSNQSPIAMSGRTGLGLDAMDQDYGYGVPGNGQGAANMHFSTER
ncbi:hypothetical protein LTR72_001382 [Exophiala xenobiotica]|nr:hypothetical protein LTR72_001382 [Exophiala xenobiotica]KAK5295817.1 hypothetical protein LTR14_003445 [Exophiala xenobiotica]KAK5492231.1 hypothetical protein LTR55_003583 [Exophiala xenobiotica]